MLPANICKNLLAAALGISALAPTAGNAASPGAQVDPFWKKAVVYFLMTDRFANGDPSNDESAGRKKDADLLRGFEGGDLKGVTAKLREGYFDALGVDAIWTTPVIENVYGFVEEGDYGKTYAYHGYWPLDWTAVDPNFGDEAAFAEFVAAAHDRGIRVIVDVIVNHAGAPTATDPVWPESWVRRGPACTYKTYAESVPCELSFTLQDIKTESDAPVALPEFLVAKWKAEGRLANELAELDVFFTRTGYPRAPKYYIVKWLTDWVRDYGVDGFRADTAKHVDPEIWLAVKKEAEIAIAEWRSKNPRRIAPDRDFYMVGEVFNYGLDGFSQAVDGGRAYDYGDRQVDFYDYGFDALINMGFPTQAERPARELFATLARELETGPHRGMATLNYVTSHDDMKPFDPERVRTFESATKLMLAPGAAQIFYGDEVGRDLTVEGTRGDATLRSAFDWTAAKEPAAEALLAHWRKLGVFRKAHPAVGAGLHRELSTAPFVFSRTLEGDVEDRVVVAVDLKPGKSQTLPVGAVFADGQVVIDHYAGAETTVKNGRVKVRKTGSVVLLAPK
jgi:alpha-amylase